MSKREKFKIFIAAYLILVKEGRVLFLKRANTGYQDGNYSLIAGHLDGGETAKESIVREAKEEAGIVLDPADLEVVHVMHRWNPDREYIDVYIKAENWKGEIVNKEPEKCDELTWFSLDDLPKNIVAEVRSAIEDVERNVFYSDVGW
ncbi:MAG: NUDIX domain-containing protein [Candidatus Pacebacteria bacterium]|nr:NUDIX domain-containing protein [Candidatus Paceibacterota bacterium]